MAEQFKQFKIGELFDRAQLGDANLKKTDLTDNGELVVTSGKTNCGILGRTTRKAKIFSKNTITVDMFGLVYYRDFSYKMVTHGRVMSLSSDIIKNREIGLYLAGSLSYLSKVFSYNNMATWKKIKELNIMLPATPAGDPDFEYMTMRIRELEAERIRELEAYLGVTGLDDTTLSASEAQALTQNVKWKKFKIGELFNVLPVRHKLIKRELLTNGEYSCYSSDTSNYGILGYTDDPEFHVDDKHSYLIFGDHTRSMRIAESDFSVLDNVKVLKGLKLSKEQLMYIETMWHKAIPDLGYARHWSVAKNVDFLLPVTSIGDIDFDYMQNYIRAIEKQTIKGVVEYKDKVIHETKKVVGE